MTKQAAVHLAVLMLRTHAGSCAYGSRGRHMVLQGGSTGSRACMRPTSKPRTHPLVSALTTHCFAHRTAACSHNRSGLATEEPECVGSLHVRCCSACRTRDVRRDCIQAWRLSGHACAQAASRQSQAASQVPAPCTATMPASHRRSAGHSRHSSCRLPGTPAGPRVQKEAAPAPWQGVSQS